MFRIEFTEEERTSLIDTLEADLSNLSVEIANTDKMSFRDGLKHRRDAVRSALEKLRAAEATAA